VWSRKGDSERLERDRKEQEEGTEMRRKLLILLALVVGLSLVIAVPVGAKKPLPKFLGEMELELEAPIPPAPLLPCDVLASGSIEVCFCPDGSLYTWRGTVDPDGDGPLLGYGMAFINLRTAKGNPSASVSPFEEIWAIYEGEVDLVNGCPSTDAALIWGRDSGVTNLSNNTYRMNGDVSKVNKDVVPDNPFLGWEGRKVHMSGTFEGFPPVNEGDVSEAPGIFRLN
jgi:hypothetical protein